MKKLLLATTAIGAMAGAAAAEVSVSGDARIGLRYESDVPYSGEYCYDAAIGDHGYYCDGERDSWNVISRVRVKFALTGETDTGLSFGADIRADQAAGQGSNNNASIWKGDVWLSGTYGTLTAGDIDSAIAMAIGHLPYIGVSELSDYNEFYHNTSDYDSEIYGESGLTYEYSFGDATVYASFLDRYAGQGSAKRKGNAWSLGGAYDFGQYSVAVGYENAGLFIDPISYTVGYPDNGWDVQYAGMPYASWTTYTNTAKTWGLRGSGDFQGLTVTGIYTQTNVSGVDGPYSWSLDKYKVRQYGIGAEYTFDNGIGLQAYYRRIKGDNLVVGGVSQANKANLYGIGASYDLGGGATLKGGIAHSEGDSVVMAAQRGLIDPARVNDTSFKHTVADIGVQMKF